MFLGVGSKLILVDEGQKCRIWDSEELDNWSPSSSRPVSPATKSSSALSKKETLILQVTLNALGYKSGKPDGIFG